MIGLARLLVLVTASRFVSVMPFMPNHVFPFQPSGLSSDLTVLTDDDLDLDGYSASEFYPTETESGLSHDGSLTHKDIIRLGCLKAVARYLEEKLRKPHGSLANIKSLSSETLLRSVYGNQTATVGFELALQEIETQAALMDAWYEVDGNIDEAVTIARQHFDDEKFEEGHEYLLKLSRAVFTSLHKGSYSSARTFTGRFLLTMQDFYSHSNWVEMGRRGILKELGLVPAHSAPFLQDVAAPFQPTCTDCTHCSDPLLFSDDCISNVEMFFLTSGYFYYPWDYDRPTKPNGKCSHGADVDRSRTSSATGGINKSTKNCRKSPHHYLHDEAAAVAMEATVHFIGRLRDVAGDEHFHTFFHLQDLGSLLQSSTSLCFVIDKSSSMRDDIKLAKDRIQQIIRSNPLPSNYDLFHFSDYDNKPAFGSLVSTTNSSDLLAHLDNLRAQGGGDCPELILHGLQLALSTCLPRSHIFVFTDAGAKDLELEQTIQNLIDRRGSDVNFFFTGRTPRACSYKPYLFEQLARRSGGQVFSIQRQTNVQTLSGSVSGKAGEEETATLLFVVGTSTSGSHNFSVDCTVKAVTVEAAGKRVRIQISQPDGTLYTSKTGNNQRNSGDYVRIHLRTSEVKYGVWTVTVLAAVNSYRVNVSAVTSVDFFYQFVEVAGRPGHLGLFPIQGEPLAGKLGKLVVTVAGLSDLQKVVGVDIQSDNGTIIASLPLEPGTRTSSNMFGSAFVMHSTPFRLQFRAVDACGMDVLRTVPSLVKPPFLQVRSVKPGEQTKVLEPGKEADVTFQLHNTGETNDFVVIYEDVLGFGADIEIVIVDIDEEIRRRRSEEMGSRLTVVKRNVTLQRGQTAIVNVIIQPPEQADLGDRNTAVITVADQTGETVNRVEMEMVVAPAEIDDTPPNCTIYSHANASCYHLTTETCASGVWEVSVFVEDSGVGLQNIKTEELDVNVTHSNFTSGTKTSVRVDAVSSCCQRDVSFLLSDVVGNLYKCSFSLPPLPTPATISTDQSAPSLSYLHNFLTEPPYLTTTASTTEDASTWDTGSAVQPTIPTQEKVYCSLEEQSFILSGLTTEYLRRALSRLYGENYNLSIIDSYRQRLIGYSMFAEVDRDRNGVLSANELSEYGLSLVERQYVSRPCGAWLAARCLEDGTEVSRDQWLKCLNIVHQFT